MIVRRFSRLSRPATCAGDQPCLSPKLSCYSRWRAIHNCRDLADCFPGLAKTGNSTAVFKRKLFILSSHRNTLLKKCCTWSVNLGNPGSFPLNIIPQIFPIGILCLDQLQLARPIPFLDLLLPCYSGNDIVASFVVNQGFTPSFFVKPSIKSFLCVHARF